MLTHEQLEEVIARQDQKIERYIELISELKEQIANHSCVMKIGGYHEN